MGQTRLRQMRINGRWLLCADGIERPVFDVQLLLPSGQVATTPFLLDTGADLTIVAYGVAQQLAAYTTLTPSSNPAIGVGGATPTQLLAVDFVLTATDNKRVLLQGPIPAFG
jgi:hypothetical protein